MEMILDPKTQTLVALGAAVAAKCQACFSTLYAAAEKVEATDSEIRAVVALANMVTEKSQGFMAAFVEETTGGRIRARADGDEATCGCGCA